MGKDACQKPELGSTAGTHVVDEQNQFLLYFDLCTHVVTYTNY